MRYYGLKREMTDAELNSYAPYRFKNDLAAVRRVYEERDRLSELGVPREKANGTAAAYVAGLITLDELRGAALNS